MNTKHQILGCLAGLLGFLCSAPCVQADYLIVFGRSERAGTRERPLYKIDLADGHIVQTITSPFIELGPDVSSELAYGGGYLWGLGLSEHAGRGPRPLYKIDPDSGAIVQSTASPFARLGPDLYRGLVYGDGYLWGIGLAGDAGTGHRPLYQIDPADGRIVQSFTSPFTGYGRELTTDLAYGGGYLWGIGPAAYAGEGRRRLYQIDPADGRIVQAIATPFTGVGPGLVRQLVYGGGYLWGLGQSANTGTGRRPLFKIDPTNGRLVQTIITPFTGIGADVYRMAYVGDAQEALSAYPPPEVRPVRVWQRFPAAPPHLIGGY